MYKQHFFTDGLSEKAVLAGEMLLKIRLFEAYLEKWC